MRKFLKNKPKSPTLCFAATITSIAIILNDLLQNQFVAAFLTFGFAMLGPKFLSSFNKSQKHRLPLLPWPKSYRGI